MKMQGYRLMRRGDEGLSFLATQQWFDHRRPGRWSCDFELWRDRDNTYLIIVSVATRSACRQMAGRYNA